MPIYDGNESLWHTMRGFNAVWRDVTRHRHESTERLCGPVGKANPWPSKTIKALMAPDSRALPAPVANKLTLIEKVVLAGRDEEIKVLPRPIAELFITVSEGNIYVEDDIRWFNDPERTQQAMHLIAQAKCHAANCVFQQAAENAAIAAGLTIVSIITNHDHPQAIRDRAVFSEAWAVLGSLVDERAFMELVGEIRRSRDVFLLTSKWEKSRQMWQGLFPKKKPYDASIIKFVGSDRDNADREKIHQAFEARLKSMVKKAEDYRRRAAEILAHKARIGAMKKEVDELTKHVR